MSSPIAVGLFRSAACTAARIPRAGVFAGLAMLMLAFALPLVFQSQTLVSSLSLIGTAVIFALAYNVSYGQTGLLSFGHSTYMGLGAYAVIHGLRLIGSSAWPVPIELVPLVGGAMGLASASLLGYVATRREGLPFAMITLGIGEMVVAASLLFTGFFGGEEGVSGNRTVGTSLVGADYGSARAVYFLIVVWAFLTGVVLYLQSRTRLGRLANAVRDNSERVRFLGFDPKRIRFRQFQVSGFFAGIAGAMAALNFEIVNSNILELDASAYVLFAAFIGGGRYFFGPILGAVVVTFITVVLSKFTSAWLLYLGLLFVATVLLAPQGLVGLVASHIPAFRAGFGSRLLVVYLVAAIPLAGLLATTCMAIELAYRATGPAPGSAAKWGLLGHEITVRSPELWFAVLALLAITGWASRSAVAKSRLVWSSVSNDLAASVRNR